MIIIFQRCIRDSRGSRSTAKPAWQVPCGQLPPSPPRQVLLRQGAALDKPLARPVDERQKTQVSKIRSGRGDIMMDA